MSTDHSCVAVLDEYRGVAFKFGDWSGIEDCLSIDTFPDTSADEDVLTERLQKPYTVICTVSERTKFRVSVLDRLSNLRLVTMTAM